MSSTKFESSIKVLPYSQQQVFNSLSDLNNLEKVKDRVPEDKVKDFKFDHDSVSINVSPVGDIKLHIIEREEPKCVKFETEKSPVPFNLWIQLLPVTEESCKMKLTLKAELNPFIKGMVSGPLQDGLEKIADALALENGK
jgi:hypothetical protein